LLIKHHAVKTCSSTILDLALNEGERTASHLGWYKTGEKDPGALYVGVWVGPGVCLDAVEKRKISCPTGNPTPAIQPVA
jgi:hypothetical protein